MLSLINRFRLGSSGGIMVISSINLAAAAVSQENAQMDPRTLRHRVGSEPRSLVDFNQEQTEIAAASSLRGL